MLLLPHPFSRFLHTLVGDAGPTPTARRGSRRSPTPPPTATAWSLVEMLASAAAVAVGRPEWASPRRPPGLGADPEMTFASGARGNQGYLAAAMIDLGRHDEGLALLEEATSGYLAAGGRTGVAVYRASRVGGLVGAGRLDEAAEALVEAEQEIATFGERFAEPLVIEADARLRLARATTPRSSPPCSPGPRPSPPSRPGTPWRRALAATAARLGVTPAGD